MKLILTCAAIVVTCLSTSGRSTSLSVTLTSLIIIDTAPRPSSYILRPDEGDSIGSHLIKVDASTGSMRLGVTMQSLHTGKSIALHMHEAEDEILFIHEGTGTGVVGNEQKLLTPGTTLYIPRGVWHGVQNTGTRMKILLVVSPPKFSRFLREIDSIAKTGHKLTDAEANRIALNHAQQDARYFLKAVLANSVWNGGKEFGSVKFDAEGIGASFARNGQINKLILRDSSPDGLGFQGELFKPDGSKTSFEMQYDFSSGKKLTIKLKTGSNQKFIWQRVGN